MIVQTQLKRPCGKKVSYNRSKIQCTHMLSPRTVGAPRERSIHCLTRLMLLQINPRTSLAWSVKAVLILCAWIATYYGTFFGLQSFAVSILLASAMRLLACGYMPVVSIPGRLHQRLLFFSQ